MKRTKKTDEQSAVWWVPAVCVGKNLWNRRVLSLKSLKEWWMVNLVWIKIHRCSIEVDVIVAAAAECSLWTASSGSRSDAETSSDCQERFRRLLVRISRLSTDDTACQSASVLSADQSVQLGYICSNKAQKSREKMLHHF